jgi:23S rRNA pseudouridine1911/1915/1917 synthase
LSGINGIERPGIVHRLDKDTSGLMVAAKSDDAHKFLAARIENREIKREYMAIVAGVPSPATGTIETQIGRDRRDRKKMAVLNEGGKEAVTHYSVAEVFGGGLASLVKCKLQTGRTHQIRVHMNHIGCPIVGDVVYGSRKKAKAMPDFARQALHAYRLSIPEIGDFEIGLPEDMAGLVEQLGANNTL